MVAVSWSLLPVKVKNIELPFLAAVWFAARVPKTLMLVLVPVVEIVVDASLLAFD